jgi:hypothetical protein
MDLGSQLTEDDVTDGRRLHPHVLSISVEISAKPYYLS